MEEEIKQKEVVEQNWKDDYLRLYADFDNYKKRTNKEKIEIKFNSRMDTLSSVLELDNDLHLSLKLLKDEKEINAVKVIADKLTRFLRNNDIEEIQTDTYDPELHEVISVMETGTEGIIDVVSKGYRIGDRVFKYPKVIISK